MCIFGGQTIENGTFKISAEILCAPVIQDGIARYTFAAPLIAEPVAESNQTHQVTPAPTEVAQDSTVNNTPSPVISSTSTTTTHAPSSSTGTNDNAETGDSANDNQLLDEFENEANSNAAVIYGTIFGIVICVICVLIVVIYKARKGASERKSLARAQTADDDNFVVAKIS